MALRFLMEAGAGRGPISLQELVLAPCGALPQAGPRCWGSWQSSPGKSSESTQHADIEELERMVHMPLDREPSASLASSAAALAAG